MQNARCAKMTDNARCAKMTDGFSLVLEYKNNFFVFNISLFGSLQILSEAFYGVFVCNIPYFFRL